MHPPPPLRFLAKNACKFCHGLASPNRYLNKEIAKLKYLITHCIKSHFKKLGLEENATLKMHRYTIFEISAKKA